MILILRFFLSVENKEKLRMMSNNLAGLSKSDNSLPTSPKPKRLAMASSSFSKRHGAQNSKGQRMAP